VTSVDERHGEAAVRYLEETNVVRETEDQLMAATEAALWACVRFDDSIQASQKAAPSDDEERGFEVMRELVSKEVVRLLAIGRIAKATDLDRRPVRLKLRTAVLLLPRDYLYRIAGFENTIVCSTYSRICERRPGRPVDSFHERGPR
jgi:hypothetical protein